MDRESLLKDHAQLLERLIEEIKFINSEEFYRLPNDSRKLHEMKRASIETYIKTISIELWGTNESIDITSILMASLFGGIFNNNQAYSLPEIKQPEIKEE